MMTPSRATRQPGARALVTGGSGGIGLATARLLAARGCAVTVVGSNADRVRRAASSLQQPDPPPFSSHISASRLPEAAPGRVLGQSTREMGGAARETGRGIVCDFADRSAVAGLAAALSAEPAFDLVVHSAGIGLRAPAGAISGADLERLFAINVGSAAVLTAAVLPPMLARRRGALAFVGSIAGAVGAAGESAYAGSKAALAAYAQSLRVELAGTGVAVTVLLPGVVDTGFFARRGVAYHRPRPKPVPADRVARALLRAAARRQDLVTVPGWLRIPIAVQGVAPQWYGRMAARWGR